jgi:signal transduction histidine kinase
LAPSDQFYLNWPGRNVLLVTTSDITQRLETEQQFIQASKMATLGEMATGVAHELNQPLSVIKTASSFFIRKISRQEKIDDAILINMLGKIDSLIFGVKQNPEHILFQITDTGTGMDRETREKLFTLFFSSKGSKGTGLGLFISQKIIAQHGGSIHVSSVPGHGSQFIIKIPKTILGR